MSNNMLLLLKTKPLEDAFDAALVYPNAPAAGGKNKTGG